MGILDNLDQLAQPALSPLQSMLLGGVNAVAPYANTTDRPTSPWAALGAAAGGMGQGIQDQRAQALKQMLGAAQVQHLGLESQGLANANELSNMTLQTYRDWNAANPATPTTRVGSTAASLGAGAPASVAPAPAAPTTTAATAAPGGGMSISLSPDDKEALIRSSIAEAGNQGVEGMGAVQNVVLNRVAHPAWGGSVSDVLNAKGQFEPVGKVGGDWRKLPAGTPEQRAVAEKALTGILGGGADPTKGSTYFQNQTITNQRGTNFAPGVEPAVNIGAHSFYGPDALGGDKAGLPVPRYTVAMADSGQAPPGAAPAGAAGAAASGAAAPVPVFGLDRDIATLQAFGGRPGADKIPAIAAAQKRLEAATPPGSYLGRDPQSGRVGLYRIPGADEGEASKALAIERAVNPEKTRQAIDQAHQMVAVEKEKQEALMPGAITQAGGIKSAETTAASDARLAPAPPTPGLDTRNMSREEAEALVKSRGGDAGNDASQKVAYAKQWRDQFTPVIDKARELNKQANVVNLALDQKNGTGDIAAITAFNKLLDEGVSVHESDIKNTLMAQGIVEQLNTWVKNKREGDMLDDPLRDKIRTLSNALHASSNEYYRQQVESYRPAIEGKPETGGMGLNYDHIVPPALRRQLKWDTATPSGDNPPPAAATTHVWNPATGTADPVQ